MGRTRNDYVADHRNARGHHLGRDPRKTGNRQMNCPVCHGTGLIQAGKWDPEQPCFECSGIGQVHCCEGLCEQPDDTEDQKVR
jgi:DnaJ-class molecular chaperone